MVEAFVSGGGWSPSFLALMLLSINTVRDCKSRRVVLYAPLRQLGLYSCHGRRVFLTSKQLTDGVVALSVTGHSGPMIFFPLGSKQQRLQCGVFNSFPRSCCKTRTQVGCVPDVDHGILRTHVEGRMFIHPCSIETRTHGTITEVEQG